MSFGDYRFSYRRSLSKRLIVASNIANVQSRLHEHVVDVFHAEEPLMTQFLPDNLLGAAFGTPFIATGDTSSDSNSKTPQTWTEDPESRKSF